MLIALSKNGAQVKIFAPNIDQAHVINHINGTEMPEKRNVLVESARIARGDIEEIDKLDAKDFDALFFPGGFGAAKNLSSYAFKGAEMTINQEVERVIRDFHKN